MVPAVDGGVVKSDTRVSGIFLRDVQRTSAALRGDFSQKVSKGHSVISNVVDPFLCPFSWEAAKFVLFGYAMSLSDCLQRYGEGNSIHLRQPKDEQCREKELYRYPNDQAFSKRFQWLPFEVEFDDCGEGGPRYVHLTSQSFSKLRYRHWCQNHQLHQQRAPCRTSRLLHGPRDSDCYSDADV
jgi:hypothetical protein